MNTSEILSHLNIDLLNGMQQEMHKACRKHKNVILLSPTGSGKTLAYLLPLVQSVKAELNEVQALILVPSRELAMQTTQVLKQMNCGINGVAVYGGRPAMEEHRTINGTKPQIIIGTPGRVLDHLNKNNFSTNFLSHLVIDEFDKCLELGFQEEMSQVLVHLQHLETRYLLSATDCPETSLFINDDNKVKKINFLDSDEKIPERIELSVVDSPVKDKLETLARLLCIIGQKSSLVFVGFRESVDRVIKYLNQQGFSAIGFHGGMEQQDRERSLFRFACGATNVMVCTDLAARGLDIPDIENVIQYHLPINEQAYIHRNGRTARWNAVGNGYIILGPEEYLPEFIPSDIPHLDQKLLQNPKYDLNHLNIPKPKWESLYIGKGKKDKLSKGDIAGFMLKIGGLERDEVGRIEVRDHCAYVSIRQSRVKEVMLRIKGQKIKGMKTIIEPTR